MQSGCQFEYKVVLDTELDSNSAIPNWIGSPTSCAHLLGSPAHYLCSVCPPWSSPSFVYVPGACLGRERERGKLASLSLVRSPNQRC
jgi:hypothetical protein